MGRKWLLEAQLTKTQDVDFAPPVSILKIKAAVRQRESEPYIVCFIYTYVELCNVIKWCNYGIQPCIFVVEVKVCLLVQLHLKNRSYDLLHPWSGKYEKLYRLILRMNYLSDNFPSYSKHSSVKDNRQISHLPVPSIVPGLSPTTSL